MLIGRTKEKLELRRAYESEYSEFAAVYGRRRVGKTFLIKEAFNYKFTFFHTGLNGATKREQLLAWRQSLELAGYKCTSNFKDWAEAFQALKELINNSKEKKKVIFIDEMPWMDTKGSSFVTWLEFFWNGWASARHDVLLIICGSAASWIIKKVFRNRGGLHNRVTYRIPVQPFTLSECEQMSRKMGLKFTRYDIIEAYMVLGGVPYYWSLLDKSKSLAGNIDALLFNKAGALHYEFNELYKSLFRQPDTYIKIVAALAGKQSGLTREELIKEAGVQNNGATSQVLQDLEQCGFISYNYPFGGGKSKLIYHLIDNFTLFYFRFMKNSKSSDENYWTNNIQSPVRRAWSGLAFEHVCFQHVPQIKKALGISGVSTIVYSWKCGPNDAYEQGAQIDMLIDRADRVVNLCEIKFAEEEYVIDKSYDMNLRNKIGQFVYNTKTRRAIYLTMITPYGVSHNSYWGNIQCEVTAEDLFKEV